MTRHINIPVTVEDSVLADILTTAIEGGINYWAHLRNCPRDDDLCVKYAEIVDPEDGLEILVTRDTVFRGLELYMSKYGNVRQLDDNDFDAEAADMVVQLGVFGKVVYG
jgi:hypothetical protein